MVNRSPLGKYAQLVAAVVAVAIIAAYLIALLMGGLLGIAGESPQLAALERLALIAAGAVFASAATINGVKEPIESAHARVDVLEKATGIQTHPTRE